MRSTQRLVTPFYLSLITLGVRFTRRKAMARMKASCRNRHPREGFSIRRLIQPSDRARSQNIAPQLSRRSNVHNEAFSPPSCRFRLGLSRESEGALANGPFILPAETLHRGNRGHGLCYCRSICLVSDSPCRRRIFDKVGGEESRASSHKGSCCYGSPRPVSAPTLDLLRCRRFSGSLSSWYYIHSRPIRSRRPKRTRSGPTGTGGAPLEEG